MSLLLAIQAATPITATSSVALPFSASATAVVLVKADANKALPFAVAGAGAVRVAATASKALPFTAAGTGAVRVTAVSIVPLPFAVSGDGSVSGGIITGQSNVALPFGVSGTGTVTGEPAPFKRRAGFPPKKIRRDRLAPVGATIRQVTTRRRLDPVDVEETLRRVWGPKPTVPASIETSGTSWTAEQERAEMQEVLAVLDL